MRLMTLLLAALVIGCDGNADKDTSDTDTGDENPLDIDGDGYAEEDGDCDDGDATVYPGADEVWYDGVDQNCDELSDYDQDADGADQGADCDDTNADVAPGATEVCDGVDNDCNGEVDESGEQTAYLDGDGDGFGTGDALGTYCELPEGTAGNADDCDDTQAAINPDADEVCDTIDNNCDGEVDVGAVDGTTVYTDADADGFGDAATAQLVCGEVEGTVADATDCDDTDALSYPGAAELCDLEDNDCDGAVDDGATEARPYYADADGDGYGDPAVSVNECGAPAGYVEEGTDCDDADATRSPGAAEVCDGVDNDCDGSADDDATDGTTVYTDADGDGWGDDATMTVVCEMGEFHVGTGGDCDDASADVSPAATEVCDTIDNNCDGAADESTAADAATWYLDADSDSYGDTSASATACEQPAGFVGTDGDCDDGASTTYPDAVELCDEVDNDCDGLVDDDVPGSGTWYADADGDSYGDASVGTDACEQPAGYVADDQDCDDTDAATYPGAAETCDGEDQDCDGAADNDPTDGFTVYIDADGDGYGDAVVSVEACEEAAGWSTEATDCDDGAAGTWPGAVETCDDVDQDCDGTVDDGATDAGTWYADADGDSFGNASSSREACDQPSGYVASASDCDDSSSAAFPGATESCDGEDNDCDGAADEAGADGESTWYLDADLDGYGIPSSTADACDQPAGYAATDDDCDDDDATTNPGVAEADDGVDNDCDESVDEGFVGAGDLVITEITRQPRFGASSTNTNGQWFELYNPTATDIDLSNWYVQRVSSSLAADGFYVDPDDSVVVPAGEYVTFCKTDNFVSTSTSYSTMDPCDYYWGDETASSSYAGTYHDNTFNLQRDSDTLAVYAHGDTSTGTLIDSVTWYYDATNGYWPRDASRSMQLDAGSLDATTNDSIDAWCSTTNNVFFQWYYVSSSNREFGTPAGTNHSCP